jgi:preprotein translocase subunit SecG
MAALQTALLVLLAITSILLILMILLHKGRGGGVADMFGGGVTSSMQSSGVAERNLNRITIILGLVWVSVIIILGLFTRLGVLASELAHWGRRTAVTRSRRFPEAFIAPMVTKPILSLPQASPRKKSLQRSTARTVVSHLDATRTTHLWLQRLSPTRLTLLM